MFALWDVYFLVLTGMTEATKKHIPSCVTTAKHSLTFLTNDNFIEAGVRLKTVRISLKVYPQIFPSFSWSIFDYR